MMTAFQFAIQNLLCRAVLKLGIVQRSANAVELDWHQYSRQGIPNHPLFCIETYLVFEPALHALLASLIAALQAATFA